MRPETQCFLRPNTPTEHLSVPIGSQPVALQIYWEEPYLQPHPEIPDGAIQLLDFNVDYSPVFEFADETLGVPVELQAEIEPLQGDITKLLSLADERTSAKRRIARQRLSIRKANAVELSYTYSNHKYVLWLAGTHSRVYAQRSPLTMAMRQMVLNAQEHWKNSQYRKAALLLRDCQDMARKDQSLQEILGELRANIPCQLWKAARKVKSFEKLLTFFSGAALQCMGLLFLAWRGVEAVPPYLLFAGGLGVILFAIFYFER